MKRYKRLPPGPPNSIGIGPIMPKWWEFILLIVVLVALAAVMAWVFGF